MNELEVKAKLEELLEIIDRENWDHLLETITEDHILEIELQAKKIERLEDKLSEIKAIIEL